MLKGANVERTHVISSSHTVSPQRHSVIVLAVFTAGLERLSFELSPPGVSVQLPTHRLMNRVRETVSCEGSRGGRGSLGASLLRTGAMLTRSGLFTPILTAGGG